MTRKILVFSDSHNNSKYINKALEMHSDADMFVHLGDGACDLSRSFPEHYEKPLVFIEGNGEYYGWVGSDRRYRPLQFGFTEFEGKKIFMTHGHRFGVKSTLTPIINEAISRDADILLFGHTHEACEGVITSDNDHGFKITKPIHIMNPGSIGSYPYTFGIISIDKEGRILLSHGALE